MLDLFLRDIKERVFLPFARFVGNSLGISPTQITLAGLVVGLLCVAACAAERMVLATFLWWTNRILDGLDGTVARACNRQTKLGGYIDIMCDFVLYSLIPVAIVWGSPNSTTLTWLCLSLMLGAYYVNAAALFMLSALLAENSSSSPSDQPPSKKKSLTSVEMPKGLIEGTESMVFYQFMLAFPHRMDIATGLFGLLVWITAALRVRWAIKFL